MNRPTRRHPPVIALLALLAAAACNAPAAAASLPATLPYAGGAAEIDVRSETSDMALFDRDRERLAGKIAARLRGGTEPADTSSGTYRIDVAITNYDRGNKYIRSMLAGPGQIHTDTRVKVFHLPDDRDLGVFTVSRTYAPSGIYGSTSNIEEIEDAFADSVAQALRTRTVAVTAMSAGS